MPYVARVLQTSLRYVAEKEARLSDWVDPRVDVRRERLRQKYGSQEEEEGEQADKVPDDRNSVLTLGSCHLEPWVRAEMDRCMTEIWLTGDAELFSQLFYFISSENVSGESPMKASFG
ncbi:hypothetical protein DPMN_111145 [Dreissena polymorpha]|uniref:Uncharacterized protein n=1 Tax=Dreissena polymorpha TaxID=45954 RepID=A0A9D4KDZ2_DREPO|nr:hypothetical protein DPMN_111145 [Dreissena polymorpha]